MKITIVQYNIEWENIKGNLSKLEGLLDNVRGKTDLVILPELFNTGFSMKAGKLGEVPYGHTFLWLQDISADGNFSICGSYIVTEGNMHYNRWVMLTPDGKSWSYNKRHLFSMSGEDKAFTRGRERLTFTLNGVRICPTICYDLRFPVWSRNRNDYDLLINVANWPESRRDVWQILLKARAIENQCFVAASNRIGTDGEGISYSGDSLIIDPKGKVIADAGDKETLITAEISMQELDEFRRKFPVKQDADDFTLSP